MTITERIAKLPVAVNIADSFRAELSQTNSEKKRFCRSKVDNRNFFFDKIAVRSGSLRLYKRRCDKKAVEKDEYNEYP